MLLLHARRDPHARYSRHLDEILRLEGLPQIAHADLDDLDNRLLADADVILLPRLIASHRERDLLVDYVDQGGKLVAFLPEMGLAERFGLLPTYRGIGEGNRYLRIDSDRAAMTGLCSEAAVPTPSRCCAG